MTARSYLRGHPIYWDGIEFRYCDDETPTVGQERPCGYCQKDRTEDGHDGCLGTLPGVKNACCGHGRVAEAYIQLPDNTRFSGTAALAFFRRHGAGPPRDLPPPPPPPPRSVTGRKKGTRRLAPMNQALLMTIAWMLPGLVLDLGPEQLLLAAVFGIFWLVYEFKAWAHNDKERG